MWKLHLWLRKSVLVPVKGAATIRLCNLPLIHDEYVAYFKLSPAKWSSKDWNMQLDEHTSWKNCISHFEGAFRYWWISLFDIEYAIYQSSHATRTLRNDMHLTSSTPKPSKTICTHKYAIICPKRANTGNNTFTADGIPKHSVELKLTPLKKIFHFPITYATCESSKTTERKPSLIFIRIDNMASEISRCLYLEKRTFYLT